MTNLGKKGVSGFNSSKTNIFSHSEILRLKGSSFSLSTLKNIDEIREKLIYVMDKNNWVGVSPQNVIYNDGLELVNDFYKKILILRNFNGSEYFEILNPSYEIIGGNSVLLHEICGSIETVDSNPFGVLNLVPTKIRVTGVNSLFENIDFIVEGSSNENQEQISILIHEINHINGTIISDGGIIRKLVKGDTNLYYKIQKLFPELIASYMEFTGEKYVIHSIGEEGFNKICKNSNKKKKWENTLPFHFDLDYDFDLVRSKIISYGNKHNILICKECFI